MENSFRLLSYDCKPLINRKGKVIEEFLNSTKFEEIKRVVEKLCVCINTVSGGEVLEKCLISFNYNSRLLTIDYEVGKTELIRVIGKVLSFIEKIDNKALEKIAEKELSGLRLPRINGISNLTNDHGSKEVTAKIKSDDEIHMHCIKYELRGLGCLGEIIKNSDDFNVVVDITELSEENVTKIWCEWLDKTEYFLDNEAKLHRDGFPKALLQLFDKDDKICWTYLYTVGREMSEDIIKEILVCISTLEDNIRCTSRMSVF